MKNKLKSSFQKFLNTHYRFYKDSFFYWVLWTFVGSILLLCCSYYVICQSGSIFSEREGIMGVFGFFLAFALVSGLSLLVSVISSLISVICDFRGMKEVTVDQDIKLTGKGTFVKHKSSTEEVPLDD